MSSRVLIVGTGRVGLSLAADLSEAGMAVTVVGRKAERPTFLGDRPQIGYVSAPSPEVDAAGAFEAAATLEGSPALEGPAAFDLLFCVTDDALTSLAASWSEAAGGRPPLPRTALHTSGVDSAEALAPWRAKGVAIAAWHPLVAVASPRTGAFRGVWFGVDGDAEACRTGEELARRLGGRTFAVRPEGRAQYHAAAVFASNFLVACLHVALDELCGASDEAELEALLPLAAAALGNLGELGLSMGATGPVTRGDAQTITSNLAVLDPERAALYRALGRELLELTAGRLEPEAHVRLEALLSAREAP